MILCDECKKDGKEVDALPVLSLRGQTPEIELKGTGKIQFTMHLNLAAKGKIHLCKKHYAEVLKKMDFAKMCVGAGEAGPEDK